MLLQFELLQAVEAAGLHRQWGVLGPDELFEECFLQVVDSLALFRFTGDWQSGSVLGGGLGQRRRHWRLEIRISSHI